MRFTLSSWAKYFSLVGGGISTAALNGAFGKWSAAIGSVGAMLTAVGAAMASSTSAGHPNGAS